MNSVLIYLLSTICYTTIMKKLLIIDGSALLFQSFYGMPNKIKNKEGKNIEAVICFFGILFKTIKFINPNELLIVFDGETHLERQDIDKNYKANRPDFSLVADEDNPFLQLEIIKDVLTKLKFKWTETVTCEADDLIASLVNDYKDEYKIIISANDKDFYQLISENVSIFTYRGKISKLWTEEEILNKYHFAAKHFSTFKALCGDPSDNIKGIKGIGIKTASYLIKEFGDINAIFYNLDKINNEKLKVLLKANKDLTIKNYKLVNLLNIHNLYTIKDLSFKLPPESTTTILKNFNII